jgi:ketopantoate reductase PanE/ApbA-like protein
MPSTAAAEEIGDGSGAALPSIHLVAVGTILTDARRSAHARARAADDGRSQGDWRAPRPIDGRERHPSRGDAQTRCGQDFNVQDMEAARPLEIDPILGVFPELGRKLGVLTPFCDAVLGLLRQGATNSGPIA